MRRSAPAAGPEADWAPDLIGRLADTVHVLARGRGSRRCGAGAAVEWGVTMHRSALAAARPEADRAPEPAGRLATAVHDLTVCVEVPGDA